MARGIAFAEIPLRDFVLRTIGALMVLIMIFTAVRAQSVEPGATAGDMIKMCQARTDSAAGGADWALCAGRLQGWMSAHYMSALAYGGMGKRLYCEPPDWTVSLIAQAFVKWGNEYPEFMSLSWNSGLMRALQATFPCGKPN